MYGFWLHAEFKIVFICSPWLTRVQRVVQPSACRGGSRWGCANHIAWIWSEKVCLTHMSLLVLTECCRSMSSQSGKQSQPASIVSLISLKNSWALLALKICFLFKWYWSFISKDKKDVVRKAPACALSVLRVLWQIPRWNTLWRHFSNYRKNIPDIIDRIYQI